MADLWFWLFREKGTTYPDQSDRRACPIPVAFSFQAIFWINGRKQSSAQERWDLGGALAKYKEKTSRRCCNVVASAGLELGPDKLLQGVLTGRQSVSLA